MSRIVKSFTSELALLIMIFSLAMAGFVAQASLAQQSSAANIKKAGKTSSKFLTYSDPSFGIKMLYPSSWLKLDLARNSSSVLIVVFKTPSGSPLASLNMLGGNVTSRNATLSTLVNANINYLRQTGKILRLISSTPFTLAGYPSHKLVYTTISHQGIGFEAMQLISLIGNKISFITYTAPTVNYAFYLPTIQTMLSSIEIAK